MTIEIHVHIDDGSSRNFRFELSKVLRSEEELSIEVGDIDRVHVNYVDVLETHEREVGQDLAAAWWRQTS